MERAYIAGFASVIGICQRARDTTEAGNDSLPRRVERLAGHHLHDLGLTRGRMEAEEIFTAVRPGKSTFFLRTRSHIATSLGTRSHFLEDILPHPSVKPAEILRSV
jgi:hypothetical protein